MKKRFVHLVICAVAYLILAPKAFAVGEFQADYDVLYAVAPSGATIVTQNVALTNLLTNLYPEKYSIVIDSLNIKNVIAYDDGGIITPGITQKEGKTEILLAFNQKIVGLGKQLRFSLRYENADITKQNGSIWEINIPGIAKDPDIASYAVALRVPPSFGPNAYMSPPPAVAGKWTKDQMVRGGVSAAYGTQQIFALTLSYFLENPTVTKKFSEIALPPDTAFQRVIVESLNPKPKTVLADSDGNWLAQYELAPTQKLEIEAKVFVAITLTPQEGFTQALADTSPYLKPLKYWESQHPKIVEVAKTTATPRAVYDYVVATLAYDYARVGQNPVRKGASSALASPESAICMEFTDLFIAVARAAGIPAREAVGYAYTTNPRLRPLSLVADILHAWPEYYDRQRSIWVPIDPTWADTTGGVNYFDKLDFNHITFAIHGTASDYPYPAGFYRKSGKTTKDLQVNFADKLPAIEDVQFITSYAFPAIVSSGFSTTGSVIVENPSGSAQKKMTISVHSSPTDVAIEKEVQTIPPFTRVSVPVSIEIPSYFTKGTGVITTTVNGSTTTYSFQIKPLVYRFLWPLVGAGILLLILAWLTVKKPLWRHRKK